MNNSSRISYYVAKNQPSKFETNEPVLLGILVFAPVITIRNGKLTQMKSSFPFDVTIVEETKRDKANDRFTRIVSNFQISLPWRKEEKISLPAPISIRPGFFYEIRLRPESTSENDAYFCGGLKSVVQSKNDINIKFYGDRQRDDGLLNIITALGFN